MPTRLPFWAGQLIRCPALKGRWWHSCVSRGAGAANVLVFVILLTVAQLADLITGYVQRPSGWTSVEHNPIAATLLATPLLAVAAKAALLALVASTVAIVRPTRPRLAALVLLVGTAAGIVGALSNTTRLI